MNLTRRQHEHLRTAITAFLIGTVMVLFLWLSNAAPPNKISLRARDWNLIGNGFYQLTDVQGGGWFFDFQEAPLDVDYLRTSTGPITDSAIQFTFNVSGNGTLVPTDGGQPYLRALLQRDPDLGSQYHRWWSNPLSIALSNGTFILSVPFTPDQWTSVYGVRGDASPEALAGWQDCLAHPRVGFTFGNESQFGHGCSESDGNVRFTLIDAQLIQ